MGVGGCGGMGARTVHFAKPQKKHGSEVLSATGIGSTNFHGSHFIKLRFKGKYRNLF